MSAAPITFSISLNKQQNSRQVLNYWYYTNPNLAKLEPNYGPESGGNEIILMGSGFFPFAEYAPHRVNATETPPARLLSDVEEIDPYTISNANDTFCIFRDLGITVPARVINSTKVGCVVPATFNDIAIVGVDLSLNGQDFSDDDVPYYFYKPPKIYDMEPREGPTRGGTDVHIYASEFKKNKHLLCIWNLHTGRIRNRGILISDTEIECRSPPSLNNPGPVTIQITYEEDGRKSESDPMGFTYYESPVLSSIEPACGPSYGQTQLTIHGANFIENGFGKAQCVFNATHHMNATVVSGEMLYCSTPKLSDFESSLPWADMKYQVQVTMNGQTLTEGNAIFAYYVDPEITAVENSSIGPVAGNTHS